MTRLLSLAFLSHLASPASPTGAEHSLALLAGGLARSGHRVLVVAPGPWALEKQLRDSGADVRILPSRALWLTGWEPVSFPVTAAKWIRHVMPPTGERALAEVLGGWGADVVHVNCLPHVHGARAARRAGIPVVWHLREILPAGARRRWFAVRLDAFAREIVAVSEAVAGWVREEGLEGRLTVVHNGVARSGATPLDPAEARNMLAKYVDTAADKVGAYVIWGDYLRKVNENETATVSGFGTRYQPTSRTILARPAQATQMRDV